MEHTADNARVAPIEVSASAKSSNANAVEPLTPTASVILGNATVLPAEQFVQPEPNADDPLFHPDVLAPWPLLRLVKKNNMNASEATRPLAKGQRIAKFYGCVQTTPSLYTVQYSDDIHVACHQGGPTFVNHSCDPNAFFDMAPATAAAPWPTLTALRDIAEGEEITFNYNTTEWHMSETFACLCGAKACLGKIEGFSHLSPEAKKTLEPTISRFIAGKWREAEAQNGAAASSASA